MQKEPKFQPAELKKAYLSMVNDIEYDQLELLNNDVTFFEIIGASKTEIRHSNFLAWILNPSASHGLGESFLKRFIREIVADSRAIGISEIEVEQLDFNNVHVLREWNNIDILIEFNELVFAIENKILSKEHSNQLTKYHKIIKSEFPNKRHVFSYLTPNGDESVDEAEKYVTISYFHVLDILERIMTIKGDFVGPRVNVYLDDYIKTLKKQVMETDESIDLARNIYKNHKDLLDFIFEHKPDFKEPLIQLFTKAVQKEGWIIGSPNKWYVRFSTKKLNEIMPIYDHSGGWSQKESFLFEIIFWSDKYVAFQVAASPGEYALKINDIILEIEGAKKPTGKKWLSFFLIKMPMNYSKLVEMDEKELNQRISTFMTQIKDIVFKVENKLIENKEQIN